MEANLARIGTGIEEAAHRGARVAVFPECALSGFDKETVAALDWARVDAARKQVAAWADVHDLYVIYGCATPSGQDKPFNSAIILNPDGAEIFQYHKMVPEGWFTPGDRLALFQIDGVPATLVICHDERYPELTRIPVLGGARILFYISYEINNLDAAHRKIENYRGQLIGRAAENQIWVVQSNGITPEAERNGSASLGYSRIVAPSGNVLEEAPELQPALLVRTLDPNEASRGNALRSLQIGPLAAWWKEGLGILESSAHGASIQAVAPPKNKATLALLQGVPVKWDLEANFKTFLDGLTDAVAADLYLTPECWLDGYAAPDKNSTPERLREIAQDPDTSPYLQRVAEEVKARGLYICFGFTSLVDGKIYNSMGLWDDRGNRIGLYHKTHLQTHDLQYAAGESLPVFPTPWGPLGIMICADRRWPETARTLRLKGAKLILNPSYGMHHEKNEMWMRTRSWENQAFIAFCHPNVGFVANPKGDITGKRDEEPGVLLTTVDLSEARDDNHLQDRRPDLYGILGATPP